ncbi:MAG: endonuclease III [Omnitrophica WOR_2 bacterium RIFCSPHIGHO2_02_FULL_48_11]|nr:MAG: endonuclease III [Omnitrophica WOR_2 bacterium RIFCSPHIGHO2_02_FULL_48_11]
MAVTNNNIDQVVAILKEDLKDLPDPSVTLVGKKWKSPFLVLISCILSLRTKDETTLPASERLFKLASTPDQMCHLTPRQIEKAIYPVGFYRTKAKNILGICKDLLERYNGQVPDDLDTLLQFKGVGRKTANLVLTEGFGKLGVCVDTHVHRISNRLGYVKTQTPEETEWALRKQLPEKYWMEYNALLVTWGQNVCKPISPFCSRCRLKPWCARKGVTSSR